MEEGLQVGCLARKAWLGFEEVGERRTRMRRRLHATTLFHETSVTFRLSIQQWNRRGEIECRLAHSTPWYCRKHSTDREATTSIHVLEEARLTQRSRAQSRVLSPPRLPAKGETHDGIGTESSVLLEPFRKPLSALRRPVLAPDSARTRWRG